MAARERAFHLERNEKTKILQRSAATRQSDNSHQKNMITKLKRVIKAYVDAYPTSNFVVAIGSPISDHFVVADARHDTNDEEWSKAILGAVVGAILYKDRYKERPLSAFSHVPPPRASLEHTLAEAVRSGLLGKAQYEALLQLAEKLAKDAERAAKKGE